MVHGRGRGGKKGTVGPYEVRLLSKAFGALSSPDGLQILLHLHRRGPKTVSEISRDLKKNKATVARRLAELRIGDLIRMDRATGESEYYFGLVDSGEIIVKQLMPSLLVELREQSELDGVRDMEPTGIPLDEKPDWEKRSNVQP